MKDGWRALADVDGFMEGPSIFSDDDAERAYFVNGTQVAQRHPDGRFHLRLTRKAISAHRAELKADGRVELARSGSDWVTVAAPTAADVELLLSLAELAAAAHRPPPGVAAKPPPTGAELARRRRFH